MFRLVKSEVDLQMHRRTVSLCDGLLLAEFWLEPSLPFSPTLLAVPFCRISLRLSSKLSLESAHIQSELDGKEGCLKRRVPSNTQNRERKAFPIFNAYPGARGRWFECRSTLQPSPNVANEGFYTFFSF